MAITLVINPGSSSKKYALYKNRKAVLEFRFEETNSGFEVCSKHSDAGQNCRGINQTEFEGAFDEVAQGVKQYLQQEGTILDAISVRVVAPGTDFQQHRIIDDAFLMVLRQKELTVPLHIPAILKEIQNAKHYFPEVKLVAASDSAFHRTLPKHSREFSIDRSDAETYDIYRFGYHGLSVASVYRKIHPLTGINPEKLIVCHIGGGVSVTALKDGKSVETTMGFAPASGLPMGCRAGDIDPGGMLQLMRSKNLKPSETEIYIHTKGGLLGLSGDSDIRRLLDRHCRGDAVATQALDHFYYHIQKAIAASSVALGGLDMIVLTGTAAVRSSELRSKILAGVSYMGIEIDQNKNDALVGSDGAFSAQKSPVKAVVARTDEMGEMEIIVEQIDQRYGE